MNKAEREALFEYIERGLVQRYTKADLDRLLHYVDALEEACRMCVFEHPTSTGAMLSREALAKGTK